MAEFNPYHAWLSIESDAPTHYELLGIAPGESRPEAISSAAANVRRNICSVKPEPEQVADWSRLLSELESAESILTDPATRGQYNTSIGIMAAPEVPMAVPINSPPPPVPAPMPTWGGQQPAPVYPSTPVPGAPMGSPVGTAVPYQYGYAPTPAPSTNSGLPDPMAPVGQAAGAAVKPPMSPAADAPNVGRAARTNRKHRQRKAERNLPVYLAIGAVGMVVLAGVAIALNQNEPGPEVAQQDTSTAPTKTPATTGDSSDSAKKDNSGADAKKGTPPKSPNRKAPVSDVAVASPMNATEAAKPPLPKTDEMGDEPEMSEPNTPAPTPDPTPAPAPDPAPPEVVATPDQIASLSKQMSAARDFLTTAEFDQADQLIKEAATAPGTLEQRSQLERLTMVADLTRQFNAGLAQSLSELRALSEVDIGSVKIAIVEVSPDKLVIRANGQNRSYSTRELPWALGLALTKDVLPDTTPENKVVKAMYLAVHHQRTASLVDRAKSLLAEAIAAGANAEVLTAFIDDRYSESEPTEPPMTPEPPAEPPTPGEVKLMSETLMKIEADFTKNNIAAAKKRLEALSTAPGTAAQLTKRQQLDKVADKLEAFHAALNKATDALKVDEEVAITSTISAKVLEVTRDKLRVELTGGTLRVLERNALPAALAVEIAKRELGDDPEAKVANSVFVFYHLAATKKYKSQAKQWLEEAGQDSDLLPIFEEF